ncbi:hypothetical protein EYC80_001425 [Monilinia laxa]|uniref:Protein kinase domain-containing protein n=1 Tax=Monilinia laxa TaxID=61186 RepID=A0A5N6K5P3_MONLA|nr:hypothetical protein EYC80_001425 [Monilinia laxa]
MATDKAPGERVTLAQSDSKSPETVDNLNSSDSSSSGNDVSTLGSSSNRTNLSSGSSGALNFSKTVRFRTPTPSTSSDSSPLLSSDLFFQRYTRHERISAGSFAVVYRIEEIATKKSFALKTPKDNSDESEFRREWRLHQGLCHQSVIRVFGYYDGALKENHYNGVVMELGATSLQDILENQQLNLDDEGRETACHIREVQMKKYFCDVLLGLQYLKSKNIIHGDMKPDNVILGLDGHMKITDFGLSKQLEVGQRFDGTGGYGALCYRAPECFAGIKEIISVGFEADIWATAVMLFQCLKGYYPFAKEPVEYEEEKEDEDEEEDEEEEIKQMIRGGTFVDPPPKVLPQISPQAEELIVGMLQVSLIDRWTVNECLAHHWFRV